MLALTRTIVVDLQKPGNHSDMRIVVEAKGERTVPLEYRATMTRSKAAVDTVEQQNGTWARNWSRLDEQQLSVHGHHLIWAAPPSTASGGIPLNAEAQKFSGSTDLSFKLRLDCDGAQACIEDGDTVETVIAVGSPGSALDLEPEVRIVARVQSLLSCRHTRALIEPGLERLPISTRIRVRVFANDVDNLPVNFTRGEIHLGFSDHSIPMQWSRGSNEYAADVLTEKPGLFNLVLSATNAWNETAGQATSCELLRRAITVEEGLSSTSWILVGAGTAAVAIVGGLALIVRKRHAHLQAILAMLFTEVTAIQMPLGTPFLPSRIFTFPINCHFGQTTQAAPHFSAN
jgi:ribosomal silencing factor RsfS